ncbi:VWA domain-containing protein [Candidatus Fermentibacteria bacterium]|nr:VWA domain-containing protein [Candidatus Fermentibacteria bacterium]
MRFEAPFALFLLFFPALWWWLRSRWLEDEMKRLRLFVRPVLWDRVDIQPPPPRTLSRTGWCVSLALLIFSLSGPMWGESDAVIPTGGDNVAVALDVSASMASLDEAPNRLGRASSEILDLVDRLPGVRFSLVLFSGQARLAVPGTLDREFIASRIPAEPWSRNSLAPGTMLGNLVDVMLASLPEEDLETRIGVIFSDGGFHDYALERAVESAHDAGLVLVTVGVGGTDSVPLPDSAGGFRTDLRGDTVRTALAEEPLRELAERTGGFYVRLSETGDLAGLLSELLEGSREMKAEKVAGGSAGRRYQYFLGTGLAAAALAMALERRGK